MAIHFMTDAPAALLAKFDARMAQKEPKDRINTWEKLPEGYSHKADNWAKKAYFEARVFEGKLTFYIREPEGKAIDKLIYAYYHGHLLETFINHFRDDFTTASVSAKPESGKPKPKA